MRRIGIVCAVAGVMFTGAAWGQGSPLASEVQGAYARLKPNILKAAEKMPAEDYSYKPTPDIRTFARVVNHVIEAQGHICGAANHVDPSAAPKVPADTADKTAIVEALNASFAECDKAFAGLTDANVLDMVDVGKIKRSRIGLAWGTSQHDTEQYATLALYL